jgi:hypothetical protein
MPNAPIIFATVSKLGLPFGESALYRPARVMPVNSSVPTTDLDLPLWQSGRPCFFDRYNEYKPRLDARDQTKVSITM